MNAAVLFYSLEGNTRHVAEAIARYTGAALVELKPRTPYPVSGFRKFFVGGKSATFRETPALEPLPQSLADYDTLILGAPIWAGTIASPLRSFLTGNDLRGKRIAAFLCCGGGKADKAFAAIRSLSGQESLLAELRLVNPLQQPQALEGQLGAFVAALQG